MFPTPLKLNRLFQEMFSLFYCVAQAGWTDQPAEWEGINTAASKGLRLQLPTGARKSHVVNDGIMKI